VTSSAGTSDSLSDPLDKMALDVGMLDRQYRKLTDRQKQAHIVVGGMSCLLLLPFANWLCFFTGRQHSSMLWNAFSDIREGLPVCVSLCHTLPLYQKNVKLFSEFRREYILI